MGRQNISGPQAERQSARQHPSPAPSRPRKRFRATAPSGHSPQL